MRGTSDRGLAPHTLTPMPGVHQRLERTRGAAGCHVRAAVTAGRSTAGREVPWSERSSMDPATTLKIGNPYTRDKIHKLLGGDKQSYLIVGKSRQGRLLIVSYTERGDAVRLISAREVTSAERKAYEEG